MRNDFESDYLMHHGVKGQRWGHRNGPPYPLHSDKLAAAVHQAAKKKVNTITNDVTAAASSAGAKMHGLENKLKTKESISRKIMADSKEKNISPFEASTDIKDAVRYTIMSSDAKFTDNYFSVKNQLEQKGYSETRCKNYFDLYRKGKVKHKSIQSVFSDPDGYSFEIQFHTPSSQLAKDKKIQLYEERRKPGIKPDRARYLEEQMVVLAKNVSTPSGVYKIKTH